MSSMAAPYSIIPTFTLAALPPANTVPAGAVFRISDLNNMELISNGTQWRPRGGRQPAYRWNAPGRVPVTTMQAAIGAVSGIPTLTIPPAFWTSIPDVFFEAEVLATRVSAANTQAWRVDIADAAGNTFCNFASTSNTIPDIRIYGRAFLNAAPGAGSSRQRAVAAENPSSTTIAAASIATDTTVSNVFSVRANTGDTTGLTEIMQFWHIVIDVVG